MKRGTRTRLDGQGRRRPSGPWRTGTVRRPNGSGSPSENYTHRERGGFHIRNQVLSERVPRAFVVCCDTSRLRVINSWSCRDSYDSILGLGGQVQTMGSFGHRSRRYPLARDGLRSGVENLCPLRGVPPSVTHRSSPHRQGMVLDDSRTCFDNGLTPFGLLISF